MRIGEVATSAGVTIKTVRHYEALGLIRSTRLNNGYRDYGEDAPRLVVEAHALSRAGIRLEQTRPFLDCLSGGSEHGDDCVTTRPAYRAAIDDLTDRIDELSRRREALLELLAAAEAREDAGCQFADARLIDDEAFVHDGAPVRKGAPVHGGASVHKGAQRA